MGKERNRNKPFKLVSEFFGPEGAEASNKEGSLSHNDECKVKKVVNGLSGGDRNVS